MSINTPFGFDFGHLRVERLAEHKGSVMVRVLNKVTGQYVNVQTSPAGRKQYVNVGTIKKDSLSRFLEDGVE
jgi:hypothetical protein